MKKEIDFKNAIRNPYVDKELKRQVTINLRVAMLLIILKKWLRKKAYLIKF
ncbi:hypothetical protein L8V83_01085 [Campylobacter lari]|nr:hypothetical protein [Campylobacter lari]